MLALAAGHRHLAHLSRQTQQRVALRTLEILVLPKVLQPYPRLLYAGSPLPSKLKILAVFRRAPDRIAREHAKDAQHVYNHAQQLKHNSRKHG